MLAKAILTGGVLSLLSGSIVYFGTEGADATDRSALNETRVESSVGVSGLESSNTESTDIEVSELAGAAETEMLSEVVTPPNAEIKLEDSTKAPPKTRWLNQYLKSTKSKNNDAEENDVVSGAVATGTIVTEAGVVDVKAVVEPVDAAASLDVNVLDIDESETGEIVSELNDDAPTAILETDEVNIEIEESFDVKMLRDIMKSHKGAKTEIRVIKLDDTSAPKSTVMNIMREPIDYAAVLIEAKKLQVIDMRDQAVLEIVDYAIDNRDIGNAADIVQELSSPELRDTARARIGKGLATQGDMEAAFAVLDEIEIDELSAPIRLEIIAALMATRAERAGTSHGLRR